ncbi:hypothetical protein NJC38_06070 [Pseudomonas sp. 21LCFQ010]|uniref:hypothetical protein n=1 Tax=Pseudomonas sp. 21LCFQ010 TaxID=2957506 RepID=UPI002096B35F|nr:hypothetical protein [Pseudomonas sp. 21LCFQ010]MCO8161720.1 hypothetical protein [Pseudomonas sp. 21LCFQ010]
MDPRPLTGNRPPLCGLPSRSSIGCPNRIVDYQLAEMAVLLRSGELTAEQLTIASLARLYRFEESLKGYGDNSLSVHIDAQQALTRARLADQWLSNADDPRGPAPLLCGIVLGISESLVAVARNGRPWKLEDSPLVARLYDQGAILLGPLRGSICPGGTQSGLSAIAPVARLCAAALAQTADDAFMMPSAAHAASGIKPSLGLAMGWDVPGTVARSVRDAALVLAALSETGAAQTAPVRWPVTARSGYRPLLSTRIGVTPPRAADAPQSWQVLERFREQLARLGARLIELPDAPPCPPQGWESNLRDQRLDFMLVMSSASSGPDRLPHVPGWPMVTFPIGQSSSGASINAAFCGPHLSDARLIQTALDFQACYPHYHDSAPPLRIGSLRLANVTAPKKAWPTN